MSQDELRPSKKDSATEKIKMEVDTRHSHSEIEKRRRDKMNQYIHDLSTMVPMPPSQIRKPDKLTVLRLTVQHMKALQGSVEPLKETSHKPSFLSDDDLRNLITEASGGFLIVVECDRGQVLYVSDSVHEGLNIKQADVVRSNFYDLVYSKDISKVKTQLSTTTTNSKKGETADTSSVPPIKGNDKKLCPGAKRSFLCRMKKGAKVENSEKAFGRSEDNSVVHKTKANVLLQDEKQNVLTSFEGYLKDWPVKDQSQEKGSNSSTSRSCLVAIGRTVAVHDEQTDYLQLSQTREFETRHRADGVFVSVDLSFSTIFGYHPDEVVGKSAYSFFHKDDLKDIADSHHRAVTKTGHRPEVIYRFRAKDGHYVPLRTLSFAFRNPWSKEVDYIVTKNHVMAPMSSSILFIREKRLVQKQAANLARRDGGYGDNLELSEGIRDLLVRIEKRDSHEGISLKRHSSGSSEAVKTEDIGVLIAEHAKKIGQELSINAQSARYSNAPPPDDANTQANVSGRASQLGINSDLLRAPINDVNRRYGGVNDSTSASTRLQNDFADGILIEQLEGIQGAIDTMEGTTSAEDDERLSLLMNVIGSDEDIGSVLSDMPWNFV